MLIYKGKCHICGNEESKFTIHKEATLYREAICCHCSSSLRNNATAMAISKRYGMESIEEGGQKLRDYYIHELASYGALHRKFRLCCRNYSCSEFFDDVEVGNYVNNIRCENIMNLTYADNVFDLIIAEDVLEHVENFQQAFSEVRRVLKKEGTFIFTIPFHEKMNTIVRSKLYPQYPVYHGDPLRGQILVHNDFGDDIVEYLNSIGLKTEVLYLNKWYSHTEITKIYAQEEFDVYRRAENLLDYFKYNNMVFTSVKEVA